MNEMQNKGFVGIELIGRFGSTTYLSESGFAGLRDVQD